MFFQTRRHTDLRTVSQTGIKKGTEPMPKATPVHRQPWNGICTNQWNRRKKARETKWQYEDFCEHWLMGLLRK